LGVRRSSRTIERTGESGIRTPFDPIGEVHGMEKSEDSRVLSKMGGLLSMREKVLGRGQ